MIEAQAAVYLAAKMRSWFAHAAHQICITRPPNVAAACPPQAGLLAASLLLAVLCAVPDAVRAEFNFARYKETDLDEFLDGGDRPPASTSTRCRR